MKGVVSCFHLLEKHPNAICPNEFLTLFNSKYVLPQEQPCLDQCPAAFQPLVQRDLHTAWAEIATATVDDTTRSTAWRDWS
jgi:hypothetical protein